MEDCGTGFDAHDIGGKRDTNNPHQQLEWPSQGTHDGIVPWGFRTLQLPVQAVDQHPQYKIEQQYQEDNDEHLHNPGIVAGPVSDVLKEWIIH